MEMICEGWLVQRSMQRTPMSHIWWSDPRDMGKDKIRMMFIV